MSTEIPYPVNETRTGIVLAYENKKLIANQVLPIITVNSKKYEYLEYPKGQLFSVPDTKVGRKSEPNQPDFEATEQTDKVDDRSLMDFTPQADIDEALEGIDPRSKKAEWLTKLMDLDHENKTAKLVFNPATYNAGLKEELTGTDRFNDTANSKPMDVIADALEVPLIRPNRMTIGSKAWSVLRRHPQIVEAVLGTSAKEGMVSRQAVAELFELEQVIVGQSRINIEKKGQPVNLQRVWGNHISLTFIDEMADTKNGITFGGSPRYKQRFAAEWYDQTPGSEGGYWTKVSDHMHEKIFAADLGYFIENVID